MSTAQLSMIAPPPSVEAVLGALTEETRIGQVDFSSRLAPEPEPEDRDDADVVHADDLVSEDAPADSDEETGEDEDSEDDQDDQDVVPAVVTLVSVPAIRDEHDEHEEPEVDEPAAADEPTTVAPAATRTQETVVKEQEAVVPASLEERIHEPARLARFEEPSLRAAADERPPTVEEIARLVIERMHDAELAMMRHLEAIEVEAARRAELLTAQAELDAELIRLSARREAHVIVTAARVRAGENAVAATEDTRLDELAESLSRFAEVVDELHPAGARTPSWGRTP